MQKPILSTLQFYHGGMDQDDAPIRIEKGDFVTGYNIRASGTSAGEDGYITNIESNVLIQGNLHAGINKIVGAAGFEQIRAAVWFIYNSFGYHQIGVLNYDTDTLTIVFENLTNSAGIDVMGLTPQNYVDDIKLINDTYLLWNDAAAALGYTNLDTLQSGGYGTILQEDFSLIKPQILPPPTGTYGSDGGQPANYLFGLLPQFNAQTVNADFNYAAWSTWSKRIVPYQQNTPVLGSDVSQNNYIIVSAYAGSIRATTLNIACRFGTDIFQIVKSVDRAYFTSLPHTSVDVPNEVYEAYDPAANLYSFAFYNNDVSIPVDPVETDLNYDYVPQSAEAMEVVNGDIVALGGLRVGYDRPATSVSVGAVGYDPNIDIPSGTYPDPLTMSNVFKGATGSGAGNHKRIMTFQLSGTPHTGDKIIVITANIGNATAVHNYTYTVPASQDGNLLAVVQSVQQSLPNSTYASNGTGGYGILFIDAPFYGGQTFAVQLFFSGAAVANSIPAVLDNTIYQLALSYRDKYGRFFPLDTDNTFIIPTPSYAQVNGNAIQIQWKINTANAPVGAVDYQWLLTVPPVDNVVDTIATLLNYISAWDAKTNTPTLAANTGTVGDTYQITTPISINESGYVNLGNNSDYKTGDYVVYNGQSWDILPKEFGDLTATGNILAFSLNALNLFNSQYASQGVDTILAYQFSQGDRCTLHYYIDASGNKIFINNPCVNLSVFGFDEASYIVKMEKSAIFNATVLAGKNTFLRLYSPAPQTQSASAALNSTVFREVGERFTITNGMHDVLSGVIYDGGCYYKTRQFADALLPYTNPPVDVLATDLNYSDFYPSKFSSFGRARSFLDELEKTEREAVINWSQSYVLGSRINGLTRFYPANVYGTQGGETSANYGAIKKLLQVNNELVCIQALNHGSIPVYQTVYEDALQRTTVAVAQKLFNPIRYTTSHHIGIGNAKSSVAIYNNVIYWVDPNRSQPVRWEGNGCFPISMKMTKFFKTTLQAATEAGLKMIGWYDIFNDEYVLSIQQPGAVIVSFVFNATNWQTLASYIIAPGDITISTPPAHSTTSYDSTTGLVTITPSTNYVGSDTLQISFPAPGLGTLTKNACFAWTAGNTTVNPFSFAPQMGVPLSTLILSNTITVNGNNIAVAISITGGQYSINGGAFTSAAGTVNPGDSVQVEVMSSGSNNTATSCTLTISATTGTFTVTTAAVGNFKVNAEYGYDITNLVGGTATGIPAGTYPVLQHTTMATAYSAIGAGTVLVTLSGTPVFPDQQLDLYIGGTLHSRTPVPMAATYTVNIPAETDPTVILFAIDQL